MSTAMRMALGIYAALGALFLCALAYDVWRQRGWWPYICGELLLACGIVLFTVAMLTQ